MADIQYTSVNELDDASTLDGSEAIHGVQSGNDVKITPVQIKEYFGVGLAVRSADCETTATTEIKEVTISDYEPTENDIVAITFDYANSWGDTTTSTVSYPKLRINGSYDFNVCDSRGNPAGKGCWKAGDTIEFRLRGNKAIILTSDVRQVNTDGTVIMSDGTTYYELNPTVTELTLSDICTTTEPNNCTYTVVGKLCIVNLSALTTSAGGIIAVNIPLPKRRENVQIGDGIIIYVDPNDAFLRITCAHSNLYTQLVYPIA